MNEQMEPIKKQYVDASSWEREKLTTSAHYMSTVYYIMMGIMIQNDQYVYYVWAVH